MSSRRGNGKLRDDQTDTYGRIIHPADQGDIIVDSEEIVKDVQEDGTTKLYLDNEISNDIARAIKAPLSPPTRKIITGVDETGAQVNYILGDGIIIEGDTSPYIIKTQFPLVDFNLIGSAIPSNQITSLTDGVTVGYKSYSIAKNNEGSICKIYGTANINITDDFSGTNFTISLGYLGLVRPTSNIAIKGFGLFNRLKNNDTYSFADVIVNIKTSGEVTLNVYVGSADRDVKTGTYPLILIPVILFVKNFGD